MDGISDFLPPLCCRKESALEKGMEGSGPYIQLLASVPAFAAFDVAQLKRFTAFAR